MEIDGNRNSVPLSNLSIRVRFGQELFRQPVGCQRFKIDRADCAAVKLSSLAILRTHRKVRW